MNSETGTARLRTRGAVKALFAAIAWLVCVCLVTFQFLAEAWLRKAAHSEEDPRRAAACIQKSIAWDPGNEEAHAALGAAYQGHVARIENLSEPERLGLLHKAQDAYIRAIELAPTESSNHMNLGWVRYQIARSQGRTPGPEVLESFSLAARLDPHSYYPHYLLGTYFMAGGRREEAFAAFRRSIEVFPSDQVIQKILETAMSATTAYEELVQVVPEAVPLAHYYFAMLLEDRLKDWGHAAGELKKAVRLDPETLYYRDYYFMLALRHKDIEAAEDEIRERSELFGAQPSLLSKLGRHFLEHGDYQKALEVCSRLEEADPSYPELDPLRAEIQRRQGDLLEAISSYRSAIEKHPGEANHYFQLAKLYLDHGKPFDAAKLLLKAASLDPGNFTYQEALGDAYLRIGMKEQAEEAFAKCTELDPGSVKAWLKLGTLSLGQQKWVDAAQAFAKALKIDPKNADALQGFLEAQSHIR